jgi:glucan phosphoethanolaminetransferase (alkaline phosphatase superfamily)
MQETTVGWEPMYEGHLPWFTKVFVVYLALVMLLLAARAIGLIRRLRALRKLEQETATELTSKFPLFWESLYAKTAAIKSLSMLTLLLSLLVFAWSTTQLMLGITMEKSTGVAFLAGTMAEVLTVFSLGILVCTVLYTFAILFEAVLVRRKMRANFTKSE